MRRPHKLINNTIFASFEKTFPVNFFPRAYLSFLISGLFKNKMTFKCYQILRCWELQLPLHKKFQHIRILIKCLPSIFRIHCLDTFLQLRYIMWFEAFFKGLKKKKKKKYERHMKDIWNPVKRWSKIVPKLYNVHSWIGRFIWLKWRHSLSL